MSNVEILFILLVGLFFLIVYIIYKRTLLIKIPIPINYSETTNLEYITDEFLLNCLQIQNRLNTYCKEINTKEKYE